MRYTHSHITELVGKAMNFVSNHTKGMVYLECDGIEDLDISLVMVPTKEVKDFLVDANFYREELSIEIVLVYNPKFNREESLNWIEWSFNEIIAHELCHYDQYLGGRLPRKGNRELPPQKYFLQAHEVEAQITGWKRVSSITGDSLERSAEIWFERNFQFHEMGEKEVKKIIQKIFSLRGDLVL